MSLTNYLQERLYGSIPPPPAHVPRILLLGHSSAGIEYLKRQLSNTDVWTSEMTRNTLFAEMYLPRPISRWCQVYESAGILQTGYIAKKIEAMMYKTSDIVVYVLDASNKLDLETLEKDKETLASLFRDEALSGLPFIILGNTSTSASCIAAYNSEQQVLLPGAMQSYHAITRTTRCKSLQDQSIKHPPQQPVTKVALSQEAVRQGFQKVIAQTKVRSKSVVGLLSNLSSRIRTEANKTFESLKEGKALRQISSSRCVGGCDTEEEVGEVSSRKVDIPDDSSPGSSNCPLSLMSSQECSPLSSQSESGKKHADHTDRTTSSVTTSDRFHVQKQDVVEHRILSHQDSAGESGLRTQEITTLTYRKTIITEMGDDENGEIFIRENSQNSTSRSTPNCTTSSHTLNLEDNPLPSTSISIMGRERAFEKNPSHKKMLANFGALEIAADPPLRRGRSPSRNLELIQHCSQRDSQIFSKHITNSSAIADYQQAGDNDHCYTKTELWRELGFDVKDGHPRWFLRNSGENTRDHGSASESEETGTSSTLASSGGCADVVELFIINTSSPSNADWQAAFSRVFELVDARHKGGAPGTVSGVLNWVSRKIKEQ